MGEETQNQEPEGESETTNPVVHEFMVARVVEVTPARHRVTFDAFAYDNALAWVHKAAALRKASEKPTEENTSKDS